MRAIGLFSGGLDSFLAISIIRDMGIEVESLFFRTGFEAGVDFCKYSNRIKTVGESQGLSVKIVDISEDILKVVLKPRFGYGSGMNPCLDCRLVMLEKARSYMESTGAKFVITGEVLGQRPMSQHRAALRMLEKESVLEGLIMRPLSGSILGETIPEKEGWIQKGKLFGIQGKSRKEQIALAREKGIRGYSQPSGGCVLTDGNYSRRLKDLLLHRKQVSAVDMDILKIGRHLRIPGGLKIIVGRNYDENIFLENHASGNWMFETVNYKGPVVIVEGEPETAGMELACGITASYSDAGAGKIVPVRYEKGGQSGEISAKQIEKKVIAEWFV